MYKHYRNVGENLLKYIQWCCLVTHHIALACRKVKGQEYLYRSSTTTTTTIVVVVVVVGATGTISKSFRKYVSNIPGNHEVKELHKTAILGTAHILRKVLM